MRCIRIFCYLVLALFALHTHAAEPIKKNISLRSIHEDKQYLQALKDARDGYLEQAILALGQLVERFPQRQDILRDYAVVMGWAGKDDEALTLYDRIDIPNSPGYVIEGLANSARHLKRFELAESLYWQSITRFPERIEPQVGLACTLADEGKLIDAWRVVKHLREEYPQHIDVLEAYAYIATAKHEDFAALDAYESILALKPNHRGALRGKMQTLAHLGAPQLALEFADAHMGILSAKELAAIGADRTALKIRWGAIIADTGVGEARFSALDLAIAESDAAGARALDPTIELSSTERQLALDRISALSQRYRMKDAISLYEAMAKRPQQIPAYAKAAVASAYLYLEHPESARDMYYQALETDPNNLNTRIGLFYALAECEAHAAALKQIDGAVAMTPISIDAWSPVTIRENPAYARAQSARAMAPMYANQPGEAEERLHLLADSAPFNMDVRTDFASTMRARGWPRVAEEELIWVLAAEPSNSGALGEHAGALLEMRDYQDAESALALAQSVDAEDGRVVRAGRLAAVHQMQELVVEGEFGRSSSDSTGSVSPRGTQDYEMDAKLYSSPLDYNYRVFGHLFSAQAKFDTGTGRRETAGVGLEYRSPQMIATGELAEGLDASKTSGAVSLALTPNDYWTFVGGYETSSNQTPLQATLAGIDAKGASVGVIWRANESRSAGLSFEKLDFTDGNQRNATNARWTERVIAGPVYKLEITAGLYASNNSLDNRPYFNPSSDFSPTFEFANEWLQWRRYTRAFRHRLVATVGDYQQQSFGTSPLYNLRYEQEWDADDRLTVRYGIGHSQQPYDGVQTSRNYGYFYLDWWF